MRMIKSSMILMMLFMSFSVQAHDSFEAMAQTRGHWSAYFWALFHPWIEKMATPAGLIMLVVLNLFALILLMRIRSPYAVSFSNRK